MNQFLIMLSIVILSSVIMTMLSTNPIHSMFWLVLVFMNSCLLLMCLGFDFLPMMIMMIYVGAMTMLFLFVIMMIDVMELKMITLMNNTIPVMLLISVNFLLSLWWSTDEEIIVNNEYLNDFTINNSSHLMSMSSNIYTKL